MRRVNQEVPRFGRDDRRHAQYRSSPGLQPIIASSASVLDPCPPGRSEIGWLNRLDGCRVGDLKSPGSGMPQEYLPRQSPHGPRSPVAQQPHSRRNRRWVCRAYANAPVHAAHPRRRGSRDCSLATESRKHAVIDLLHDFFYQTSARLCAQFLHRSLSVEIFLWFPQPSPSAFRIAEYLLGHGGDPCDPNSLVGFLARQWLVSRDSMGKCSAGQDQLIYLGIGKSPAQQPLDNRSRQLVFDERGQIAVGADTGYSELSAQSIIKGNWQSASIIEANCQARQSSLTSPSNPPSPLPRTGPSGSAR